MTLEVATYVADLQPLNPPGTDAISQGDDHLRLIKQVLQNTLTGASRAYNIPSAKSITTTYSVLKTDGESILYVSTAGGAVTITLPSLTSVDAGWKVWFVKTTSDANPMFVKPASGTLNSGGIAALSQARRCIPGVQTAAIWDGAAWFATRASAAPIGTVLEYWGSVLPPGYEWPIGQTLSSANYPEYNAKYGSGATPDLRGFASLTLDNLGGVAAGRLPNGFISGSTLGAIGGVDSIVLVNANLPAYTPAGTIANGAISISHNAAVNGGGSGTPGPFTAALNNPGAATITPSQGTSTFFGSAQGGVSQRFSNLQPSVMMGKILVVE